MARVYTYVICDLCGERIPVSWESWQLLWWWADKRNLFELCHCHKNK